MQLVPKENLLLPRKDQTVTIHVTETTSIVESTTIRETLTLYVNVTVFTTMFSTVTQFSTMNSTTTAMTTIQPPTLARLAPEITSAIPANEPTGSLVAAGRPQKLQTGVILAVVLGALAFLTCIGAAIFFLRRFHQRYRAERVARKQAVTEGNQYPDGFPGSSAGPVVSPYSMAEHQAGFPLQTFGRSTTTRAVSGLGNQRNTSYFNNNNGDGKFENPQGGASRWPREEKEVKGEESWEEHPPAYGSS